jgi:flagellum-specific ATP synthase
MAIEQPGTSPAELPVVDFASAADAAIARSEAAEPMRSGRLVRMHGLTLEARGVSAPIGACCAVLGLGGETVEAEVVGFNDRTTYLMPFGDPSGIGPGATVRVHR